MATIELQTNFHSSCTTRSPFA